MLVFYSLEGYSVFIEVACFYLIKAVSVVPGFLSSKTLQKHFEKTLELLKHSKWSVLIILKLNVIDEVAFNTTKFH